MDCIVALLRILRVFGIHRCLCTYEIIEIVVVATVLSSDFLDVAVLVENMKTFLMHSKVVVNMYMDVGF
jgi:hypothetical protein